MTQVKITFEPFKKFKILQESPIMGSDLVPDLDPNPYMDLQSHTAVAEETTNDS